MSFPILQEYQQLFPVCEPLLSTIPQLYTKKLWNELTLACLEFIYHPSTKGNITFAFYTDFVKRFQKNIDQTNLLKIFRQSVVSLPNQQILTSLQDFEKEISSQEGKMILAAFKGFFNTSVDMHAASEMMGKVKTFTETHKDVDSFLFSSYYKLCYTYYAAKRKYKLFYNSALQYLAYTQPEEIEEKERLNLLYDMAVAVLVSEEIYNFSELLEQPLLVELKNSKNAWLYQLIEIFNRGDITRFTEVTLNNDILKMNAQKLQQKIRLMSFLELAFNLPKNNRVVTFEKLSNVCGIPLDHVEFMVMKSMALKLVRGSIDQINQNVTITWVAPKVLETDRISTMLKKFQEWEEGVKGVENLIGQVKA